MKTVLYECQEPLSENQRWIAWLTEERAIIDKQGKKTGRTKIVFLPVYFFGLTSQDAQDCALAFWDDERAKAAAKKERARTLGLSRRAA